MRKQEFKASLKNREDLIQAQQARFELLQEEFRSLKNSADSNRFEYKSRVSALEDRLEESYAENYKLTIQMKGQLEDRTFEKGDGEFISLSAEKQTMKDLQDWLEYELKVNHSLVEELHTTNATDQSSNMYYI